jgi:hypothetical protein
MNAGRCPRCNKFLIAEQEKDHACDISVGNVREIVLDYMTDGMQDENGDVIRVGWGLDHVLYRLIVCRHNPPHRTKRKFTDPNDQTGTCQCWQVSCV